jgi:enediyne biosynthesis protein E4
MDGDGDLDLFVANYVAFNFENHQISHMSGFPAYVGPVNYPPTVNVLYRNNGDGTFTDVSVVGHRRAPGNGMGMICADYDHDGDTDIVVGNDLGANFVFQNDGAGHFKEVGLALGLAYDALGNVHGTMAVECADWNNDGWLDFYMTSYQRQLATLYESKGASISRMSPDPPARARTLIRRSPGAPVDRLR